MLFSQVFSFFQNNKKRTTPSKQPSPPSPTTATSTTLNPSAKSSSTSSVSNEQPLTPLSQAPPPLPPAHHHTSVAESDIQIPQVEFEQSRSLLQLDFFGPDQQQLSTDFPQFDHLLNKPPISETGTPETKEHYNKFGTLNRKLTKTLRHRLSLRPGQSNKRIKRSISTPNLA
ncbi:hypothetical protein MAM1_0010d01077 [Mucor ambiguus]|uniref:Uncharacterized protein n=1 Tax=Mucor ambiguus TaxID=91626 RepID=A0A0C9MI70_9FUNG|nr:hypothetical protein MAM1_0010d01077 [Mucor ambiguus]